MNDYGTVSITLHRNLTEEQWIVIVKMAVENQIMTRNRNHFNEILNQCLDISKFAKDDGGPITVTWNLREYKYTMKIAFCE